MLSLQVLEAGLGDTGKSAQDTCRASQRKGLSNSVFRNTFDMFGCAYTHMNLYACILTVMHTQTGILYSMDHLLLIECTCAFSGY